VVAYIFIPSGREYFKKGEYQKVIDEFEYIKQILLVEIPLAFAVSLLLELPVAAPLVPTLKVKAIE